MPPKPPDPARPWHRAARRLAWRVNAGWWLKLWLPWLVGLSVAQSALLLWARGQGHDPIPCWAGFAVLLGGVGALTFLRARPHFFGVAAALVRLDVAGRLHNRLTAAHAGVGPWPEPDPALRHGIVWRSARIATPVLLALGALLAAGWIPIRREPDARTAALQEPPAWTQVSQWVDELAQQETLRDEDLERMRERVAALRGQPEAQWYRHHSLEAGDHLRDQLSQAIQGLDRDLALAQAALAEALATPPGEAASQEALREAWKQALQGLGEGALRMDAESMQALKKLDPSRLQAATAGEIEEALRKLDEASEACRKSGLCRRPGEGPNGRALGNGGIQRGPGAAPLTLAPASVKPEKGQRMEAASNPDLQHASLGDQVGTSQQEHEIDPDAFPGTMTGGQTAEPGGSGEAVWRQDILPDEQAVLQKYFHD